MVKIKHITPLNYTKCCVQYGMFTLYLGIGEGDVMNFKFKTHRELTSFIAESFDYFTDKVFLCTSGDDNEREILITENYEKILLAMEYDFFNGFGGEKDNKLHIHEYPTYEDAYKVATDMREGNPLCYGG